jgi:transglutaminase-like putative cysteine protease
MTAAAVVRRDAPGLWLLIVALFLLLSLASPVRGAGEPLYQFSPAPGWVKPLSPEYDAPLPASGVSDGRWELLNDRQIALRPDGHDTYWHRAARIITASGVDSESQIDVSVDPTYQSLLLHSIRVVRQGRVIDHAQDARIIALPEETSLRERVYNGGYNVNILLPDVRTGDVVEYDYTLRSTERIFPGHFSAQLPVAWSIPLRHQRLRILAPADERLSWRAPDGPPPRSVVHDGLQELEWEWRDLTPIPGDPNRPSWYSPWPRIELSNAPDWSDVVRRTQPLFEVKPARGAVADVVADIRTQGGDPATQALHALQFVQEQIRYVSISIGRGAFRPASPATVLQRRFGDCKDKALLLATLLTALGIEAQPALVNSRRGHVLDAELPTPYAFDHAIVRMKLGENVYWLDGTADKQLSALSAEEPADFERALVLDHATTGLAAIPRPAPGTSHKRSEVLVDLRAGLHRPGKLQITTYYYGRLADAERQSLADQSVTERQKRYVDYIVRYYPSAKVAGPITIQDDPSGNVLAVKETYQLDPPFTKTDLGRPRLFLQADEIYSYLEPLKSPIRSTPLAISYPAQVEQRIRALLPQRWSFYSDTVSIDNPAFRYRSVVSYSETGNVPQLTVDYQYESRSSFVDVAALPAYQADRRRAYDDSGYTIRPPATAYAARVVYTTVPGLTTIARPAAFTALLSLLVGVYVAVRYLLRWDPPPVPHGPGAPAGIRGWLLLPALAVVLGPVTDGTNLYIWSRYIDVAHWTALHDTVPEIFRPWAPAMLLGLTAFSVLLLVARALLMYLFFSKRSSAPQVFIVVQCLLALHSAALLAAAASAHLFGRMDDGTLATQVLVAMLRAGGLTLYLLRSRRVRATFVRRVATPRQVMNAPAPAA